MGLDISSSCIGYCILDVDELSNDIKYVSMHYLKPSKKGKIMERIVDTRNKLNIIINEMKPDYIAIEDLIKFMPKSTATTVVVLTTFNRMICLLAHDYLQRQPELFNVLSIRHGLKTDKTLPQKQDMPELIAHHLNIRFPYIHKKSGKINEISMDMADGVAVALYYAFLLTGRVKRKGKKL